MRSDKFAPKASMAVLLASLFLLSACGIKGDLETPPPIWGDKSDTAQPVEPASSAPDSDR